MTDSTGPRVRKNRTDMEISRDMLELAREGVGKTKLMYGANLSFELLQKYIGRLVASGLLSSEQGSKLQIFRTTERGEEFLSECRRLKQLHRLASESESKLRGMLGQEHPSD